MDENATCQTLVNALVPTSRIANLEFASRENRQILPINSRAQAVTLPLFLFFLCSVFRFVFNSPKRRCAARVLPYSYLVYTNDVRLSDVDTLGHAP